MLNTPARDAALPRSVVVGPLVLRLAIASVLASLAAVCAFAQDTTSIDDQKWQERNPSNAVSITYSGVTVATAFELVSPMTRPRRWS